MYCPNCGVVNSTEQAFCRGCGMNLERVADALTAQKPEIPVHRLDVEERRLERFGNIAFTGFGIVGFLVIAAIIYTIVVTFVLSGSEPIAGILMSAFVLFAGLALGYVLWAESLKEKRAALLKKGRANLAKTPELQLNPSTTEPADSITEQTTRDLSDSRHR